MMKHCVTDNEIECDSWWAEDSSMQPRGLRDLVQQTSRMITELLLLDLWSISSIVGYTLHTIPRKSFLKASIAATARTNTQSGFAELSRISRIRKISRLASSLDTAYIKDDRASPYSTRGGSVTSSGGR